MDPTSASARRPDPFNPNPAANKAGPTEVPKGPSTPNIPGHLLTLYFPGVSSAGENVVHAVDITSDIAKTFMEELASATGPQKAKQLALLVGVKTAGGPAGNEVFRKDALNLPEPGTSDPSDPATAPTTSEASNNMRAVRVWDQIGLQAAKTVNVVSIETFNGIALSAIAMTLTQVQPIIQQEKKEVRKEQQAENIIKTQEPTARPAKLTQGAEEKAALQKKHAAEIRSNELELQEKLGNEKATHLQKQQKTHEEATDAKAAEIKATESEQGHG